MALKELKGLKLKGLGREELEERLQKIIEVSPPRVKVVPYLTKGFALERIEEGEEGFAIFEIKGIVVEAKVTAAGTVSQYSGCYVIHPRSPIRVIPGTLATKTTTVRKIIENSKTIDLKDGETVEVELPNTVNSNKILY